MSPFSTVADTVLPLVESRPAGGAPLGEALGATAAVLAVSVALGWLLLAHRSGRTHVLDRVMARLERTEGLRGVAGWASLSLMVAMVSLITALLGMYWDIALHISVGRDEGPLANPAHYPILIGLYGLSAAGALACALPRGDQAGPAAVRVSREWRMPVGGVLLTGAGGYALLGFPLDDIWHRIFGQDVTLWGPTHLMLIGGAGLSLIAMAVLLEEGIIRSARPTRQLLRRRWLQRVGVTGGLLIGLSVFQAEFDFGVPQFRLVLQPLLIAVAAGLALVTARLWIGRGGAIATVGFYLVVRGGVSVVVGPAVLGNLWSAVPLYLAEAVLVELVALRLEKRPFALAAVSGVLIGTVGFAVEGLWTNLFFRLPWTLDIAWEGTAMAVTGGVAGALVGALLARGLQRELPGTTTRRLVFGLGLLGITAAVVNGLVITRPTGLEADVTVASPTDGVEGTTSLRLEFDRPPLAGEATWLDVTAWQGGGGQGLVVEELRQVSPTVFETTEPVPVGGTWKTLVRLHDGRDLSAFPVYLPEDPALDEPVVPAEDGTRTFGDEKKILQRELKDDVPMWLWTVAGLVVLACSVVLVLALGWGVSRWDRLGGAEPVDEPETDPSPSSREPV